MDTYGSALKKYHETREFDEKEIYPYITEGIGEDIIPKNIDFDIIDQFEKVTDKDGAVMARRLAREEGILLGYSAGSAVAGLNQLSYLLTKDDVVVVVIHDHGSRYVGKIYNDDWMRERGFLSAELTVKDIIANKKQKNFIAVDAGDSIKQAFDLMKSNDISQMPVMVDQNIQGSITESTLLAYILENPINHRETTVSSIMNDPFPMVKEDLSFSQLGKYINKQNPAILCQDVSGTIHIITQYDIIQSL